MYKRAFLFSSNAPITLEEQDGSNSENKKLTKSTDNKEENSEHENEDNVKMDEESIKSHPGNKASYCVFCKGKTFLNKESVDKHLKSKNHLKNVNKKSKDGQKADRIKTEFLKRMKEVDKRSFLKLF